MIFDVQRIEESKRDLISSPVSSQVIYNTTRSRFEYWDGTAWKAFGSDGNIVNELSGEPTGFPMGSDGEVDRTSSTISFNKTSRTLSIAPTNSHFSYLRKGTEVRVSTTKSATITDSEGLHFFYFDSVGDLVSTMSFSLNLIYKEVYVAYLYWDSTNKEAVHIGDERHGCTMDAHTHARIHQESGAVYVDGMIPNDFTPDGNGSLSAHATFSVAGGSFRDEDIKHTLASRSRTQMIPVLYREGANGVWRKKDPNIDGSYYPRALGNAADGSGIISYNQYTGGVWTRTAANNNQYILYHVVATNDINHPYLLVMGSGVYSTKPDAKAASISEITTLSGLPFQECVFVASVLYKHQVSASNSLGAEIVSIDGANYIDWRYKLTLNPVTANLTSHNNLSGLYGSSPYYHSNQPIDSTSSPSFVNLSLTGEIQVSGTSNFNDITLTLQEITASGVINDVYINSSAVKFSGNPIITGFSNTDPGKILTIYNTGTGSIVIKHSSPLSLEINRINSGTGNDITLPRNGSLSFIYDASLLRWLAYDSNQSSQSAKITLANGAFFILNQDSNSLFSYFYDGLYTVLVEGAPIQAEVYIRNGSPPDVNVTTVSSQVIDSDTVGALCFFMDGDFLKIKNNLGSQKIIQVYRDI